MLTAVVDIGDTSVCSELSNNRALAKKENRFLYFLLVFLFFVWIFDINDILVIFPLKKSQQIYSYSYNIILFCTCMCYIPHSTCDGSDISCMDYFNPDLRKTGPTSQGT